MREVEKKTEFISPSHLGEGFRERFFKERK
jgi:hypothetical protein